MSWRRFKVTWLAHAMASTRAAYFLSLRSWISLHSQMSLPEATSSAPMLGIVTSNGRHLPLHFGTTYMHALSSLSTPCHLPTSIWNAVMPPHRTTQLKLQAFSISFVITSLGISWSPPCMHLLQPPVQYLPSSSCTLYNDTMSNTSMWMPAYSDYVLACDFCWSRYHTCVHMKA